MSNKLFSLYRKRLAHEKGTIRKDWGGRVSIALVYPNYYNVGMSNLGFQVLYNLFNQRDDVVAERVFLPEDQEMSLLLEAGKALFSLESQSPLMNFDIIAFSLSFENDYPNILKILQLSRIPLLSKDRDESCPLIMAGGIASFLNPEPVADFFDLFLLGEAEPILDKFLDLLKEFSGEFSSQRKVLGKMAENLKAVYVPSLYEIEYNDDGTIKSRSKVGRNVPSVIDVARNDVLDLPVKRSLITTSETEFADRIIVELGRGCGRSCRFCAAGYAYRPPRTYKEEDLQECINESMMHNKRLGLLSASVLDTPGIERIFGKIYEKGGTFSVSSLRAELLTEEILDHLKKAGQKTLAIAPEAGSDRLRRVINKHLTSGQITEAARMIARAGNFSLRLYFLIGLPTETREDLSGIVNLVKSIKHHMIKESRNRGRIGYIRLSVNCFIPKPFTPFQWFPMESVSVLKEKQQWLKKAFSKEGGVKVTFDVPKWAYIQSLLSLGDRRVASILLLANEHDSNWTKALRHSEINPDFFVLRAKKSDENLPWDFINHGVRKIFLIKEHRLALKETESATCDVGRCDRCGVCGNLR